MRVMMISSYGFWGEFNPAALWSNGASYGQLGGGETAMLHCARGFADHGHEVFLFCAAKPGKAYGIDWMPLEMFTDMVTSMDSDVLISFDFAHAFRFADRARAHVLAFQLNDAQVGVFDNVIDQYWHPSVWHHKRFVSIYPEINGRKGRTYMTNGVSVPRYSHQAGTVLYNPHRVVYTSSPDRGLHHLLRFWPRVRDAVPDAELHIYYDVAKWLALDEQVKGAGLVNPTGERAVLIHHAFNDPPAGVRFIGGVGQMELAKAQLSAGVLCYPCDPVAPTEGFSMTILEGITAGCNVITSNADALEELWSGAPNTTMLPLPVHDDAWVTALVDALVSPREHRVVEMFQHTWPGVNQRQLQAVQECLQ